MMNPRHTREVALASMLAAMILLGGCGGAAQPTAEPTAAPSEEITPAATHEVRPTDTITPTPEAVDSPSTPTGNPDQPVNSDTPSVPQKPDKPGEPGGVETGLAMIQSMDILTLESFPVQINVMLKGNLPDGCTQIGTVDQSFDAAAKTFTLKVSTTRPAGMMCTEALVPFEKSVALDVKGLAKGTYTVNANGHIGTFELAMDNGPLAAP